MKTDNKNGFSLIELMIAMAIFSVVIAAIYGVYISTNKTITTQNAVAGVQQNTRSALEVMVRDIRMAGYNIENLGLAKDEGIEISDDNARITIRADMPAFKQVTYERAGDELRRIRTNDPDDPDDAEVAVIIDNVSDLTFRFGGSDTSVVIELVVEEPAGYGERVSRRFGTTVYSRNLEM